MAAEFICETDDAGLVPASLHKRPGLMHAPFRAVLSPCIGVCALDDAGLCLGCHRNTAEIARWAQMNDDERLRLMETVLPLRQACSQSRRS